MARKGFIPTMLGTAVTGPALTAKIPSMKKKDSKKMGMGSTVARGLLGFGLAHIVLKSIDLIRNR